MLVNHFYYCLNRVVCDCVVPGVVIVYIVRETGCAWGEKQSEVEHFRLKLWLLNSAEAKTMTSASEYYVPKGCFSNPLLYYAGLYLLYCTG